MSRRDWKRVDAVERIGAGKLTSREAAEVLGLQTRQMRRLRRAVDRRGAAGVLHGKRGREPSNRVTEELRGRIVELRRKKYAGCNDQHFTEKLCEVEGVRISRPSVQRILRAQGIGPPRRRRPPKHRRRRDRKAQAGPMILWDGSRHEWLEERGPMLCLMGAIADATGERLPGAHVVAQECAAGYLRVLKAIAEEKGLPFSAYMGSMGNVVSGIGVENGVVHRLTLRATGVGCRRVRTRPRRGGERSSWHPADSTVCLSSTSLAPRRMPSLDR